MGVNYVLGTEEPEYGQILYKKKSSFVKAEH